ncbi:hypothetical protein OS493_036918 [Desmophyllum pertusum]|uniref:L-asparaginase n=1 Tax=Desmophyllum pertusum TaxID=174260 RepID=A0A9W9ZVF0_9CNID|nr:hypothetical protein OS493_036918 [Desmophyllum pertusum]
MGAETAVDAVEVAIRILEDDPTFDAGHGSVLTEEMTVEVDAMIMDGHTLESGAVAAVTAVIIQKGDVLQVLTILDMILLVQWAMDSSGRLACATSTGGISLKMPGRVGDSPLIGCGGYANKEGAVSTTGHGESIMKSDAG